MSKIAVIGATGMLGQPVARELIKAGYEVTILARNPDKAKSRFPSGAAIVRADVRDQDALKSALAEMDFLYMNLAVSPAEREGDFHPEREGLQNTLKAAKENGIQRVGYISSIISRYVETGWWVFRLKREAVRLIQESGIPYVIFYPSTFMETAARSIQGNKLMVVGNSRYPNWWIAGEDYGKQVARAFEVIPKSEGRDYIVQGPEALTFKEAAQKFVENYSKQTLKVSAAPMLMMKAMGLFSPQMRYLVKILDIINNYPEKFEAEPTWEELGTPTVTVEEFAQKMSNVS